MSEEKEFVAPEESVVRVLELQSKYGMDQETMLIYLNSVNLMTILDMVKRKYHSGADTLPLPQPSGMAGAPGNSGSGGTGGLSMENLAGMLSGLMGQGGGKGLNPAALLSLYNMLGGPNMDLSSIMSMLGNMLGPGKQVKPPGQAQTGVQPVLDCGEQGGEKSPEEGDRQKRDTPKIMKWDHLDDRKRAIER